MNLYFKKFVTRGIVCVKVRAMTCEFDDEARVMMAIHTDY